MSLLLLGSLGSPAWAQSARPCSIEERTLSAYDGEVSSAHTSRTYDAQGRLLVEERGGQVTRYAYLTTSEPTRLARQLLDEMSGRGSLPPGSPLAGLLSDPEASWNIHIIDARTQRTVYRAVGHEWLFRDHHDAQGRHVRADPLAAVDLWADGFVRRYDRLGRVVYEESTGYAIRRTYDAYGHLVREAWFPRLVRHLPHDRMRTTSQVLYNEPVYRKSWRYVGPHKLVQTYAWFSGDPNLDEFGFEGDTPGSRTCRFEHAQDPHRWTRRVCSSKGARVSETRVRYNDLGLLTEQVDIDRDGVATRQGFRYDDRGLLVERVHATPTRTARTTFAYDAQGRLVREDGPDVQRTWSFDDQGRLTHVTRRGPQDPSEDEPEEIFYRYDCPADRDARHTELPSTRSAEGAP
ncbi:MAG: hypothetical protein CMH57_14105 [Myxococcales bacterium]|nr:hypothetical protein [Myxococcales bacterium]